MREHAEVQLPGGLWHDGERQSRVRLRAITGRDEERLSESAGAPPVDQATCLLSGCIDSLGTIAPVSCEVVAALTIGDREALLLHLRRLTFGPSVQCVGRCGACGEAADLALSLDTILHGPYEDWRPEWTSEWEASAGVIRVRYRVPTGADLAAIAGLALENLDAAKARVLERCVLACTSADGSSVTLGDVDATLRAELPALMAARDPQGETLLTFNCPACGCEGQVWLDAAELLFGELGVRVGDLYRQVHRLATRYHWSEAEILALPRSRRWRYLELLAGVPA